MVRGDEEEEEEEATEEDSTTPPVLLLATPGQADSSCPTAVDSTL